MKTAMGILAVVIAILATLGFLSWAGERVMTWAEARAKTNRFARVVLIAGQGVMVAIALVVWSLLLYNAYESLTAPRAGGGASQNCQSETDNRGTNVVCD